MFNQNMDPLVLPFGKLLGPKPCKKLILARLSAAGCPSCSQNRTRPHQAPPLGSPKEPQNSARTSQGPPMTIRDSPRRPGNPRKAIPGLAWYPQGCHGPPQYI